nr:uncharacterized protein LOC117223443 isoform X1 [Megalopta genalis]XP_033331603.1 uncharacterized protein LOC117223443 isoform X1 [Megalopta genalis]
MHRDNRGIPTIDGASNCTLGKRPPSAKSQRGQTAKILGKNRTLYTQRRNGSCNLPAKERSGGSASHRKHFTEEKRIDPKDRTKSRDKCSNDTDYDDAIAALHREIEDWKISEALTSRTEERFTGTPSEHRTFSYVASGETTKRQRSPNNPLKSVRTYIDFPAVTSKQNIVDCLDLQKGPSVPSSAVCHRKMHSQSSCDCYCKTGEPTHRRRNGIQCDRSRVRLVTSKTSVCKTDTSRSGRNVPLTPANPVNDDRLDSKRSATMPPVSPDLSPETSAALENVDRLVKDAQIQIKAINMVADCNGFQTPVKTYSAEVSLDDENDQLLYVRERVAWKFQEANSRPDASHGNPKTEGISYERKLRAVPRKITDFSAPKFKMPEERCKEFRCCGPSVVQDPGISGVDTQSGAERAKGAVDAPSLERNPRLKSFSYQACPTVNIERQLTARNLESIHISPDPSFVQENANVGTYIVSHGCGTKGQARKEKFAKIFEEPRDAANSKRPSENRRKKHGTATNEVKDSDESSRGSVSRGSSADISGTSAGASSANVGNDAEDAGKRDEGAAIGGGNEEDIESVTTEDVVDRKPEDREARVEIETFEEGTDCGAAKKGAAGVKSEHKQVRFSEEVLEEVPEEVHEDIIEPEARNNEERSKPIELEDFLPAGGIKIRQDFSSPREREEEKEEKKVHDERNRERECYKVVEENFASLRRKYCDRNDRSLEDHSLPESLNLDTSGEGSEGSTVEEELYDPAIEEFDDVLLAYSKMIEDASQSIRTIDEYLTRPELREFLQNDAASQYSESTKPARLRERSRNDLEMPKRKSVRDERAMKHKDINEGRRSCGTMTRAKGARSVKSRAVRFDKPDCDSEKKRVSPESSMGDPLRGDSKVGKRTDARISSNAETALTESDSGKIARHIEKTLAKFFQVQRSRSAAAFRAGDESSSLISSANVSSASTDTRSLGEDKLEAASRVLGDLEKEPSPQERAVILQEFEGKQAGFEDKVKNALDLEKMMPILMKNLLENFQSDATGSPHNLELLITENAPVNNVESNAHEMDTARLKTDDESEEKCSGIRTDAKEIVKSGVNISEKNASGESVCENIDADFVDKPASRSSNSEQVAEQCLKQENSVTEPSNVNSSVESLRELLSAKSNGSSNRKMEDGVVESCEYVEQKGNNDGNLARMETDRSRTDERVQSNVSVPACEGAASETTNSLSIIKNKGAESTRLKDSVNEDFPSKASSRVENERIELSELDQNKRKIPVEYNDRGSSSSDSLRDCVSLGSSSRNEPKLLKTTESTGKINETDQITETNDPVNSISSRVFNEEHPRGHTFEKEKILSDLYDEIHEQLLHSTLAANHSTLVQQNPRTLEDMPPTVSQTIESVSLDTSRSEGELFMPSSGSCSLGEIKMLNTNDQDNIITVFVTKETLTLWSESSKSLVQSIGEI